MSNTYNYRAIATLVRNDSFAYVPIYNGLYLSNNQVFPLTPKKHYSHIYHKVIYAP